MSLRRTSNRCPILTVGRTPPFANAYRNDLLTRNASAHSEIERSRVLFGVIVVVLPHVVVGVVVSVFVEAVLSIQFIDELLVLCGCFGQSRRVFLGSFPQHFL